MGIKPSKKSLKFSGFLQNHEIKKQLFLKNYGGLITIIREKTSLKELALKTLTFYGEDSCGELLTACERRENLFSPCIINLLRISLEPIQNFFSSKLYQVNLLYEYFPHTLKAEIIERKINKQHFTENQLLNIIDCILSALIFFKNNNIRHENINPCNIFLNNDKYLINDIKFLMENSNNVNKQQENFTNPVKVKTKKINKLKEVFFFDNKIEEILYFSPEKLKKIKKKNLAIFYDYQKSDVFSLGIVLLEIASLTNITDCYNLENLTINEKNINKLLFRVKSYYSEAIYLLLSKMLIIEEINRPNFEKLFSFLVGFQVNQTVFNTEIKEEKNCSVIDEDSFNSFRGKISNLEFYKSEKKYNKENYNGRYVFSESNKKNANKYLVKSQYFNGKEIFFGDNVAFVEDNQEKEGDFCKEIVRNQRENEEFIENVRKNEENIEKLRENEEINEIIRKNIENIRKNEEINENIRKNEEINQIIRKNNEINENIRKNEEINQIIRKNNENIRKNEEINSKNEEKERILIKKEDFFLKERKISTNRNSSKKINNNNFFLSEDGKIELDKENFTIKNVTNNNSSLKSIEKSLSSSEEHNNSNLENFEQIEENVLIELKRGKILKQNKEISLKMDKIVTKNDFLKISNEIETKFTEVLSKSNHIHNKMSSYDWNLSKQELYNNDLEELECKLQEFDGKIKNKGKKNSSNNIASNNNGNSSVNLDKKKMSVSNNSKKHSKKGSKVDFKIKNIAKMKK